jgi:uncharacterized pyridoxamine 5'-phosphate oxidase family protein
MTESTQRRWLYEELLDRTPPFSVMPTKIRVPLHLALMEVVGLATAFYMSLPVKSVILGSLAIITVAIWSQMAIYVGPEIRSLRDPSSPQERRIIGEYKRSLFSRERYELLIGLVIFGLVLYYLLFTSNVPLSRWLGPSPHPVSILLVTLLLWDIAYRMGLSVWASLASLHRSARLLRASMARFGLGYTSYRELNTLKRLDGINAAFLIGVIPILPICAEDPGLLLPTVFYSVLIFGASICSWMILDRIPIYPPEVLWLLNEAMYAYVGTSSKDGQPHVSPVIFVFDGKSLYFLISKVSRKLKNFRQNNRVALLIDVRDPADIVNNRAILIKGTTKIFSLIDAILRLPRLANLRKLFVWKYPAYVKRYAEENQNLPLAWRTTLFVSRLLVRVDMEEFAYWRRARRVHVPV